MIMQVKSSQANNKAVESKLDVLEQQTKQFIGERQGAWELHYSNQEIGLRKKADKNKELLQLHQTEAQVPASSDKKVWRTLAASTLECMSCLEKRSSLWPKQLSSDSPDHPSLDQKLAGSPLVGEDGDQFFGDNARKPTSGRFSDHWRTSGRSTGLSLSSLPNPTNSQGINSSLVLSFR